MKKFLVLYMMPVGAMDEMMKDSTPEQRQAGMDKWANWMKMHAADLADMGAPVGKNKRVMASGASDVRNDVCGYSVIQAESQEDVSKMFSDNPHLEMPGAYIEVAEIMVMPGM